MASPLLYLQTILPDGHPLLVNSTATRLSQKSGNYPDLFLLLVILPVIHFKNMYLLPQPHHQIPYTECHSFFPEWLQQFINQPLISSLQVHLHEGLLEFRSDPLTPFR